MPNFRHKQQKQLYLPQMQKKEQTYSDFVPAI